ncbi:MAG: energy transducer TonB [Bacteroidia bacterium]|nr:energy transducer TonB [Bacteroidia bacterium]
MFDNLRKVMDFDDLLFETRNRDYGAYQLRKRYNSVVIAGIILASLLVSSAVIIPFIFNPDSDRVLSGGFKYVQVQMENLDPPIDEIIVPPAPPPPEAARIQEVVKYTPPVVVDTVLPLETTLATTDEALAQPTSDQIEVKGTGNGEDLLSGQEGIATDEPFFVVEVMPSFKGGDIDKFREWVLKRTNYPQIAIDKKIQGRVFLTFIVETDGAVSNVTIIKGVDPILDDEAVKTIQASPKWSPGLQRGQPVRVRYQMSLSFVF